MNPLEYKPNLQYKPAYQRLDSALPPDFGPESLTPRDWVDQLDDAAQNIISMREFMRSTLKDVEMPITPEIQKLMEAEGINDLSFESYLKIADESITHATTDLSDLIDEVRKDPSKTPLLMQATKFNPNKQAIIDHCQSAGFEPNASPKLIQWAGMAAVVAFSREATALYNMVGYLNCTKEKLTGQIKGILNALQGSINTIVDATKKSNEQITMNWGFKVDPGAEGEDCSYGIFASFDFRDNQIFEMMVKNGLDWNKYDFKTLTDSWNRLSTTFSKSGMRGWALNKWASLAPFAEMGNNLRENINTIIAQSQGSLSFDKSLEQLGAMKDTILGTNLGSINSICKSAFKLLKQANDACAGAQIRAIDLSNLTYRMNLGDKLFSEELLKLMELQKDLTKFSDILRAARNMPKINKKPQFYLGDALVDPKSLFPFRPQAFDPKNMFKLPPCPEYIYTA